MSYGGEAAFTGPSQAQKQATQAKQVRAEQLTAAQQQQREAQIQSSQATQTRNVAPGAVARGSPQDIAVRAEAAKDEQQRMVSENVHQIGSSSDQFQAAREEALKTGSFAYTKEAPTSLPSIVTPKGDVITRNQELYHGTQGAPQDIGVLTTKPTTPTPRTTPPMGSAPIDILGNKQTSEQNTPIRGTQPKGQVRSIAEELATLQGLAAKSAETPTEAVPFLSLSNPFTLTPSKTSQTKSPRPAPKPTFVITPTTAPETSLVKYTSILDVAQFLPLGGLGFKTGSEALKAGSIIGKTVTTKGEIVIPKGVKPTEEMNIFEKYFAKPEPTAKPEPSMEKISLGRGTGKTVSTGEKGGLGSSTKPGSKPPGETPKTTSAGKGLEQIVKEKEVPKTETSKPEPAREKAMQEYQEKLTGKGKGGKTTEEEIFLTTPKTGPKTRTGFVFPISPTTKPTTIPPVIIATPKPKSPSEGVSITDILITKKGQTTRSDLGGPFIPSMVTAQSTVTTTKETTKQGQEGVSATDILQVSKGTTPPPEETGGGILGGGLGGSLTGGGGRGEGSGVVKTFTGNVPIDSIIGVYKRSEISYGQGTAKASRNEKTFNAFGSATRRKGKIL